MKQMQKRECQPCTACCDGWVQMEIRGVPVYPGKPCPHSTGSGCNDYANRPTDPCVHFNCGWVIENSPLPDWMKPNEGGVIVLFKKMTWRGYPVDLAVPVGAEIPARSLAWLKAFAEQNMRPLIYSTQIVEAGAFQKEQLYTGYGPPAFQEEISRMQAAGEKLW